MKMRDPLSFFAGVVLGCACLVIGFNLWRVLL